MRPRASALIPDANFTGLRIEFPSPRPGKLRWTVAGRQAGRLPLIFSLSASAGGRELYSRAPAAAPQP